MSFRKLVSSGTALALIVLPFAPIAARGSQAQVPVAPGASPVASTPTELPEIGHVQTGRTCDAVRTRIAPTLLGVMRNDEALLAARRALSKMRDEAGNNALGDISNGLQLERAYLRRVVAVLDHNVHLARRLGVATPPASGAEKTKDPSLAAQSALAIVINQQAEAADTIAGIVETDDMGQMQASFPKNGAAVTNNPSSKANGLGANSRNSFISVAGLPDGPSEIGLPGPETPVQQGVSARSLSDGALRGHTVYDNVMALLAAMQPHITAAEIVANDDVVEAVKACVPSDKVRATPDP
jgi:hypothetical protein